MLHKSVFFTLYSKKSMTIILLIILILCSTIFSLLYNFPAPKATGIFHPNGVVSKSCQITFALTDSVIFTAKSAKNAKKKQKASRSFRQAQCGLSRKTSGRCAFSVCSAVKKYASSEFPNKLPGCDKSHNTSDCIRYNYRVLRKYLN